MRIIGGRLRGLALAGPGSGPAARGTRPTSDRVREAVFNLLAHGPTGDPVPGARVLDLFAGTGALGLEALSRGAAHVTFVEDAAAARALVRRNVERAGAGGCTRLWRRDATRLGTCHGAPFDLVLLDPPYGRGLGARAIEASVAGGWLAPDATIVWEDSDMPGAVPAPLHILQTRRYGDTAVTILRAGDGPPEAGRGRA